MLGVSAGLAPAVVEAAETEELRGDPFPWTESLSSGAPLLYSGMLRWQASALQVNIQNTNSIYRYLLTLVVCKYMLALHFSAWWCDGSGRNAFVYFDVTFLYCSLRLNTSFFEVYTFVLL